MEARSELVLVGVIHKGIALEKVPALADDKES